MGRSRVSAPLLGAAVVTLLCSLAVAAPAAARSHASPFAWAPRTASPAHVSGADGSWTKLPPPQGNQAAAAYDPLRERMLVFGGQDESRQITDALWSLSLSGTPAWTRIVTTGPAPGARLGHVLLYDSRHDRLLLFGGADSMSRSDIWALPLATPPLQWTQLSPTGTPPSRRAYSQAVYDSLDDRVVVFGGADSLVMDGGPIDFRNDVWALSLSGAPAWSELTPAGTPPSPRAGASIVYDRARQQMVLFHGYDGTMLDDGCTLSLDGSPTWAPLEVTGDVPLGRCLSAIAYDAPEDRVVVFGGLVDPQTSEALDDVWSLDLATPAWTELLPAGDAPSARAFAASAYDAPRNRMVIYGGDSGMDMVTDAVWSLSLGADPEWINLELGRPPVRMDQAAAYDPTHNVMVVFGGQWMGSPLDDAWSTPLGASPHWTALAPTGTPPAARWGHTAIYDPVRDRFLFFGGDDGVIRMNDLWELSLSPSPAWTELAPAGTPPDGRSGHTAVYDDVNDRMIVFGGATGAQTVNDVWALSLSGTPTWTQLTPAGEKPLPRWWHSAAMDQGGNRMIVFGGDHGGVYSDSVWALALSGTPTWTRLAPGGPRPAPRCAASMVTTSTHLIVFGGELSPGVRQNDAWLLTLYPSPQWRPLDTGSDRPQERGTASAVLDVATFDLYVFGGMGDESLNDLWVLSVNRTTGVQASLVSARAEPGRVDLAWQLTGSSARATVYRRSPVTAWTRVGTSLADGTGRVSFVDRDVAAGSRFGYCLGLPSEAGETFAGEVWVDVPSAARFALRGLAPNPAPAGTALVRFSLPDASPARLDVLDVTGRRVFGREVGGLGGGEHVRRVGGREALRAGLYIVRLTRGGQALTAKAVIVN